jgi:hypothetical protein
MAGTLLVLKLQSARTLIRGSYAGTCRTHHYLDQKEDLKKIICPYGYVLTYFSFEAQCLLNKAIAVLRIK